MVAGGCMIELIGGVNPREREKRELCVVTWWREFGCELYSAVLESFGFAKIT